MGHFLKRPGFLLARVDQICTVIFGTLSEAPTLSQAEFLLLLDRVGPMIQIALARAAGVDKSTTAYILDNLQDRGWIERTVREHDRRSSLISLTSEGQAILPRVRRNFAELQLRLEAPFRKGELAVLTEKLYHVGQNEQVPAPLWRVACDPVSGVLDGSLSFLSRRALQMLHAQFLKTAQATRLTLRQFSLLFILSQRQSITQTEFAQIFGVDPATCAVIMRAPARRGLIDGMPCEKDRRARNYTLTSAGWALLKQVHPLVDQSEAIVFRRESPDEIRVIVEYLHRIVAAYSHLLRFPGAIA